jgi:hypothetical protein
MLSSLPPRDCQETPGPGGEDTLSRHRQFAGSGIDFEDRGERELKGVPGTWRLHAVVGN